MSSFIGSIFGSSSSTTSASAVPKTECAVCLAAVSQGDAFTDPSGCGHLLHLQCFMQAQTSLHSTCPTCRAPFKVSPPVAAPPIPPGHLGRPPQQQQAPYAFGTPHMSSRGSVPPEEPLNFRAPVTLSTATAAPGPADATAASDPVVEVQVTPEVPAVVAGTEQKMFINVSTVSQDTEVTEKSRVGVDLVMILDKSGSMSGQKEKLLRDAVEFVIGELNERDRLCSIAFDNRATCLHGLINMGSSGSGLLNMGRSGKNRALEQARGNGLRSSGGTDICAGLRTGVDALNARKIPNAVTTIFLLTDGIDNRNLEEKLALARHARSMGWFMFIFAFGSDHNAAHLNAIAEAADSSYVFIDNVATVREAFGGAIGSQQGVAGKLLNLTIQAADTGVIIHRAVAGQYASNVAADGRMAIVTYPNLLIGEKRDCCVEVTLPAVSGATESTVVLNATLTYTPATAENSSSTMRDVTVNSAPCAVSRPTAIDTPLPRNAIVDSQINRLTGIETIERATALADANNLEEARALVTRTKTAMASSVSASLPSTQAMLAEMTDCMGRLQTKSEWQSVGRSEQMESCNVHKGQRGVFSKKSKYGEHQSSASAYSNMNSKACQSRSEY